MPRYMVIFLPLLSSLFALFIIGFHYFQVTAIAWSFGGLSVLSESHKLETPLPRIAASSIMQEVIKHDALERIDITTVKVADRSLFVTYHMSGRLGNQMFQYASMLGIARAQGRKIVLPRWFKLNKTFQLKYQFTEMETSEWTTIKQEKFGYCDTRLLNLPAQNVNIQGYLQSHKYFDSIEDEIRQEFTFCEPIATNAENMLQQLTASYKGFTLIGVHVRRGDFVGNQKYGYSVPETSYFYKAFKWMKDAISQKKILFLVASDDHKWSKQALRGKDIIILPQAHTAVHLAVLTKCDHAIIAGGTFGWWSAWLAGGYVVYFIRYMENSTLLGKSFSKEDYYPSSWIGLDN